MVSLVVEAWRNGAGSVSGPQIIEERAGFGVSGSECGDAQEDQGR
jgi:hypothetical protein